MENKLYRLVFLTAIIFFAVGVQAQRRNARYVEYINKYSDLAVEQMKLHKIPASITLAQGLLESGAGNSQLARKSNNHFGIKCGGSWRGRSVRHDDDARNECFRAYKHPRESYEDHSDFLKRGARYAFLFKLDITDYKGWARGLKKAGYATAPDYAQKLIKIIEEEELYQFDKPGKRHRQSPGELNYKLGDTKNYQSRVVYINNIPCIKVQEGDTFEGISQYFGIPLKRLLAYNDKNELSTRNGMHIFLKKKKNKAPKGYTFHKCKPGDTMYMISQIYGIKLAKLLQYNYMENGDKPQPGEMISLRGAAQLY